MSCGKQDNTTNLNISFSMEKEMFMCVMSPNWFETTSRGGFGGAGYIWIDGAVWTLLNQLDLDPWSSADRPLVSYL